MVVEFTTKIIKRICGQKSPETFFGSVERKDE
jgi:hypothetical protein